MQKTGPIIIIEDDIDDQEMLGEIFKKLKYPNKVLFFSDGEKALEHIIKDPIRPFLVLSDINMPRINGFELRKKIQTNEELTIKCIPYLFFTTSSDNKAVLEAYALSVQGFFVKPSKMEELENTIKKIVEYWQECYSPTEFV